MLRAHTLSDKFTYANSNLANKVSDEHTHIHI